MTHLPKIRREDKAFSLIEVVFAVAIVAFSLVIIVGLLPVGLKNVRETEDDQAMGAIVTQIRTQVQQLSLQGTNIAALDATNEFFSQEGVPITGTTELNVTNYYKANFMLSNAGVASSAFVTSTINGGPIPAATNVVVSVSYPPPNYPKTNVFAIMTATQAGN
jgi:uncharacterized protein (TIGR02598 family)